MKSTTLREFLEAAKQGVVIDVRSPSEFAQGHIPGALNVPLFDDEQRRQIGTTYRRQGRQPAVMLGLEIAGPRLRQLAEQLRRAASARDGLLLHCWRGGMRSQSIAWLVQTMGMQAMVLEGGYKTFRRAALESFRTEREIVVLAGLTGSGKTMLLRRLRAAGEQVIDLEELANHRGSAFGGIGKGSQPTVEQFENSLFLALRKLDPGRRVWIEDESPSIGKVRVPHEFWWLMRRSAAIFVDVDRSVRIPLLLQEYGDMPQEGLAAGIQSIARRLGDERARDALSCLATGDLARAVEIVLDYYDHAYLLAGERKPRGQLFRLALADPTANETSQQLIATADDIRDNRMSQLEFIC